MKMLILISDIKKHIRNCRKSIKKFARECTIEPNGFSISSQHTIDKKMENEEYASLLILVILMQICNVIVVLTGIAIDQAKELTCIFGLVIYLLRQRKLKILKIIMFFVSSTLTLYWTFIVGHAHMMLIMPAWISIITLYTLLVTRSILITMISYIINAIINLSILKPRIFQIFAFQKGDPRYEMLEILIIYSVVMAGLIIVIVGYIFSSRTNLILKLYEKKNNLKNMNKHLCEINKQLEESLKGKENFLLSVSHELRNPLNIIVGTTDLALLCNLDLEMKKYLERIKINTELLTLLVNNLLDSAKIQYRKLELSLISIEIAPFIEKLWLTSKVLIEKKNLKGEMYVSKSIPENIQIDPFRVTQIVYNLVSNSVKFTQKGYVGIVCSWINANKLDQILLTPTNEEIFRNAFKKVTYTPNKIQFSWKKEYPEDNGEKVELNHLLFYLNESENVYKTLESINFLYKYKKISSECNQFTTFYTSTLNNESPNIISSNHKENSGFWKSIQKKDSRIKTNYESDNSYGYLKIEVIDSGCGIPDYEKEHLFKKFNQLGNASQRQLGTGLGLWISKTLCEQMHGALDFTSKENKGSVFVALIKCKVVQQQKFQ